MTDDQVSRRDFIRTLIGGTAAAGLALGLDSNKAFSTASQPPAAMPTRALGQTGHQVKIFSLGGQATLEQPGKTEEALAIINRAIDLGVNYIDTAAAYGQGVSETYIGQVMKTRRQEVFLATKTNDRTYDGSMRLLEKSLKQLQTDKLDLWQLHNVRYQADLDKIFAADGALKALEKARDEKIVRFLGITGHFDPSVLKKGIEQYPFDSVLMALNAADKHNASFMTNLLPFTVEKKISIVGMKIPARGRMFREGGITTMKPAMRYVLTLPVSTIIVGISTVKELEENVEIAKNFTPCSSDEMLAIEELTKPYFADATWFNMKK